MSESIADLYVALTAQTAPLIAGFTEAGKSGDSMAEQVLKAAQTAAESLSGVTKAAQEMAAQVRAAGTEAASGLKAVAESAQAAASTTDSAYSSMAASAKANADAMKASAATIVEAQQAQAAGAEGAAAKTVAATKAAATGSKEAAVEGAAATGALGAGWGKSAVAAQAAAASHTGASNLIKLGMVGIGLEAVKMAGNFQASTDVFTTTAGEDVANMDKIRAGMLQLSTDTGTDADKMVGAMYKIESSHIHGAQALNVLKAAAQGAKIENSDLTKTADALTTTMTDFHFPADQAAQVMSKLVAAAGGGKLTMEEMAGSLHSVENVAGNVGLSLDQVGAALATLTMHGMSADQATENLRNAIQNLAAPNQVARKEMEGLGINVEDLTSKLGERGLSGTYKVLTEAIANHVQNGHVVLDLMQNSAVMTEKAKRELEGMPPAVKNLAQAYADGTIGIKDYMKAAKALPADQGNLALQFKTTEDRARGFSDAVKSGNPDVTNFIDAMKRMTGGTTGLGVALGLTGENATLFDENIDKISGATAQADGNVKGWDETQKRFNQTIDKAKESIKNFAILIGDQIIPKIQPVLDVLGALTGWFTRNEAAARVLGTALTVVLVGAFTMLAKKVGSVLASMAKEFIGLGTSVTEFVTSTKAKLTSLGESGQHAASTQAKAAEEASAAIKAEAVETEAAATRIKAAYTEIGAAAQASAGRVVAADAEAGAAAGGAIVAGGAAKGGKHAKGGKVAKGGGGMGLLIGTTLAGAAMSGLTDDDAPVGSTQASINHAGKALNFDFSGIVEDAKALPQQLKDLGGRISQSALGRELTDLFGAKKQHQTSIIPKGGAETGDGSTNANSNLDPTQLGQKTNIAAQKVSQAWKTITQQFDQGKSKVGTAIGDAAKAVTDKAKSITDGLQSGLKSGASKVTDWASQQKANITQKFADAGTWLTTHGKSLMDGFRSAMTTAYTAVSTWLGQRKADVQKFFADAGTWLTTHAKALWDGFQKTVTDAYNATVSWWRQRKTDITNFFSDAGQWLVNAGKAVLEGFLSGLKSAWGAVQSFVGGIGDWIAAHKGPVEKDRELLVEHGGAVMDGFHRGLMDRWERTKGWLRGVPGELTGAIGGGSGSDGGSVGWGMGAAGTDSRAMMQTFYGVGGSRYWDAHHQRPPQEKTNTSSSSSSSSSSDSGGSGKSSGSSSSGGSSSGGSSSSSMKTAGEKAGKDLATGVASGVSTGAAAVKTAADKLATDAINDLKKIMGTVPMSAQAKASIQGYITQLQGDKTKVDKAAQDTGTATIEGVKKTASPTAAAATGKAVGTAVGTGVQQSTQPVTQSATALGAALPKGMQTGFDQGKAAVLTDVTAWAAPTGPLMKAFYGQWGMNSATDVAAGSSWFKLGAAWPGGMDAGFKQGQAAVEQDVTKWAALNGPLVMAFLKPWGMTSPTDIGTNTTWYKIGLAIDQGMAKGITDNAQLVTAAAEKVASDAAAAGNKGAGVKSPSWKTYRTAMFMALGYVNSFRDHQHMVNEAAVGQARGMLAAIDGFIPAQVRSSALINTIQGRELAHYQAAQKAAQQNSSSNSDGSGYDMGGSSGGRGGGRGHGGDGASAPDLQASDMWAPRGWGDQSGWYGLGGLPGITSGIGSGLYGSGGPLSRLLEAFEYGGRGGRHGHGYDWGRGSWGGGYGRDSGGYGGFGGGGGDTHHHWKFDVHGHVWQTQDLVSAVKRELIQTGFRNTQNGTNFTGFGRF